MSLLFYSLSITSTLLLNLSVTPFLSYLSKLFYIEESISNPLILSISWYSNFRRVSFQDSSNVEIMWCCPGFILLTFMCNYTPFYSYKGFPNIGEIFIFFILILFEFYSIDFRKYWFPIILNLLSECFRLNTSNLEDPSLY